MAKETTPPRLIAQINAAAFAAAREGDTRRAAALYGLAIRLDELRACVATLDHSVPGEVDLFLAAIRKRC